ncbi:MAG: AAA family ATPase [Pirellulaceae bacterium]
MSNVLRIAIVDPNDSTRENLKSLLLGMDMVWLEAECSRYEFFADVLEQTGPDLGIVAIDDDPDKALALVEKLGVSSPQCSMLVLSESQDSGVILRSMRAGAKEFLTLPLRGEELVAALERISSQRDGGAKGTSQGSTVIAVAGATGGVGTTSLAVNLGCALAANQLNSVALVDFDLALGDADVFLDAIPDYTLVDVAQNVSRLDFSLLKRSLTKHSSGLYLLPRPVQLEDARVIDPDSLQRVIELLKATFSHLIVDLSKSYSLQDFAALDAAKHVLLVTQLDLPCLRNVVRLMMSFDEVEGLREKIRVVINRVGLGDGQIRLEKAEETIGQKIYWQIPNDYRTMVNVRNNGVPLIEAAPRAGITHSIVGLAESLTSTASPTDDESSSPDRSNWLSFWPRKSKVQEGSES